MNVVSTCVRLGPELPSTTGKYGKINLALSESILLDFVIDLKRRKESGKLVNRLR